MVNLLIDAGNSRIKYQLVKDSVVVETGVCALASWRQFCLSLAPDIDKAYISFVGSDEQRQVLADASEGSFPVLWLNQQMVIARFPQFTPAYTQINTLGLDRILAIIAARLSEKQQRDLIVIDAGTAMTLDLLSEWDHRGGYIVPGVKLQQESLKYSAALTAATAQPSDGYNVSPGNRTESCIQNGILAQLCSMINWVHQSYPEAAIYLTGGDRERLQPFLTGRPVLRDNLVLDGMRSMILEGQS